MGCKSCQERARAARDKRSKALGAKTAHKPATMTKRSRHDNVRSHRQSFFKK